MGVCNPIKNQDCHLFGQEGSQVLALGEHPNVEDRVSSPVLHYLVDFPSLAFSFSIYDVGRLD